MNNCEMNREMNCECTNCECTDCPKDCNKDCNCCEQPIEGRKYQMKDGQLFKSNKKWKSIGCTLYMYHSGNKAYQRQLLVRASEVGFTSIRCVLCFEGKEEYDDDSAWSSIESVLKLADEMDFAVTVETISSGLSWLQRKGHTGYEPEFDDMFKYIVNRTIEQFENYQSLFAVTILNEVLPFPGAGFEWDPMSRRMQMCSNAFKKKCPELIIGSGGLLHMGPKSGGRVAMVNCDWIDNGEKKVPYWEAVYSYPKIDMGMIHIYSTIEKINEGNSEWTEVKKYVQYCLKCEKSKPFIIDEYGLKIDYISEPKDKKKSEKEGLDFLTTASNALTGNPSMVQFWNFNQTSQQYDWWPTYFTALFKGFHFWKDKVNKLIPRNYILYDNWDKNDRIYLLNILKTIDYDLPTSFKVIKLLSVSGNGLPIGLKKNQVQFVGSNYIMNENLNVPSSMVVKYKLRLVHKTTGKKKILIQNSTSWRQNFIIPHKKIENELVENGNNLSYPRIVWGDILRNYGTI